ncbi:hypothetical protein FRC11_005501 [Ceratobasidium sp. 423]|nr:hypothetical protein FRC11_005501 [Ceratobasidium sp. 423]
MLFEKHGLVAQIVDSDDNELPGYQVGETADNTMQCWIPSTEGSNFKIQWNIVTALYPGHDIPSLDGVEMTGVAIAKRHLVEGYSHQHYRQLTGNSTARLYEFGKRVLTDSNNCAKPDKSGQKDQSVPYVFSAPQDTGPIHEKAAKKGHSGAVKLGKAISVPTVSTSVGFTSAKTTGITLDEWTIDHLNTVQVDLRWGNIGRLKTREKFKKIPDTSPIHEESTKEGTTDAVKLGKTISIPPSRSRKFSPNRTHKRAVFIFKYAPEGKEAE